MAASSESRRGFGGEWSKELRKRPVKCMLQGLLSSGDFGAVHDGEAIFSGAVGGLGGGVA